MKSVQIERRRQKAREEQFDIKNLGNEPIYSRFEVTSTNHNTYAVTLRDLSAPGANGCNCPDYIVNHLGTCKHIEAVCLYLQQFNNVEFRKARLKPPPFAFVFLSYGEVLNVEVRRPLKPSPRLGGLIDSHFDFRGRFRGDPITHFSEFLEDLEGLPQEEQNCLRIAEEVRTFIDYEQSLRSTALERARMVNAVQSGRVVFNPLKEPLYPFQVRGALFLAFSRRALLADEMGLGKTVQALAAAVYLKKKGLSKRALIVCPASLKRQWLREIVRFTNESVEILEGRDRHDVYQQSEAYFHIISYDLTYRDLDQIKAFSPDLVILDEAQRIKNWRTRTAKAVKEIPRKSAFVLTGTPIESDLEAVYSIVQFLDQRLLGPLWRYNERYFRFDGRGRHIGYRNLSELKERLSVIFLRRTKGSVRADLPDMIENSYAVELDQEARSLYQDARRKALAILEKAGAGPIDSEQRAVLDDFLKSMSRACSGFVSTASPEQRRQSSKLQELKAILEEMVLAGGKKVLVFAQNRELTGAAVDILNGLEINHVHFHAGVPEDERAAIVAEFTTNIMCRVFVSTDLGSTGLNLQVADALINLDQPWSAARRKQRIGRIFRLGRQEPVQVVNLVADATVEEAIPLVTGVDRTLLSRYSEADITRGPIELAWTVKGRSLREALVELLIAPPRRLPKRPKSESGNDEQGPKPGSKGPVSLRAVPQVNETPSLFESVPEDDAPISTNKVATKDIQPDPLTSKSSQEKTESTADLTKQDEALKAHTISQLRVRSEAKQQLAIAQTLLRSSFAFEALLRLRRAFDLCLIEILLVNAQPEHSGLRQDSDELIAQAFSEGKIDYEVAAAAALIVSLCRASPEKYDSERLAQVFAVLGDWVEGLSG